MRLRFVLAFWVLVLLPKQILAQHPADRIPSDCHVYAEFTNPVELVDAIFKSPIVQAARSGGLLAELENNADLKRIRKIWDALTPHLRGRAAIGARFGSVGPAIFLVADKKTDVDFGKLVASVTSDSIPLEVEETGTQRGIRWAHLGKAGILGQDSSFLYFGERPSSLREMSRLSASAAMTRDKRYRVAKREADKSPLFMLADFETLLKEEKLDKDMSNFIELLLFQGIAKDFESAKFGYLFGEVVPHLQLRMRLVNKEEREDVWHRAGSTRMSLPPVKNVSGHLHFDRNLPSFWSKRLDIVPEAGRPDLAEFSQTMNIFLSGFPFSDLMAKTSKGMDILVREVERKKNSPEVLLPEFALLLNTTFDQRERERFMVAFQTAIGVINADAGQERRQPMLQFSKTVKGNTILAAKFLADPVAGKVALEYNFTPSLAFSKGRLILASSVNLAADVVDALESTKRENLTARRGDRLELGGKAAARMLQLNKPLLVESRVLEEGEDEEEASKVIDALIRTIENVESIRVNHVALRKSTVWDLVITTAQPGSSK